MGKHRVERCRRLASRGTLPINQVTKLCHKGKRRAIWRSLTIKIVDRASQLIKRPAVAARLLTAVISSVGCVCVLHVGDDANREQVRHDGRKLTDDDDQVYQALVLEKAERDLFTVSAWSWFVRGESFDSEAKLTKFASRVPAPCRIGGPLSPDARIGGGVPTYSEPPKTNM